MDLVVLLAARTVERALRGRLVALGLHGARDPVRGVGDRLLDLVGGGLGGVGGDFLFRLWGMG